MQISGALVYVCMYVCMCVGVCVCWVDLHAVGQCQQIINETKLKHKVKTHEDPTTSKKGAEPIHRLVIF